MARRVRLALSLPQLQNQLKRDPEAYREEFEQQWRRFGQELAAFRLDPSSDNDGFRELVGFISAVAPCFKKDCKELPSMLISLLDDHSAALKRETRYSLVSGLILLRRQNMVDASVLLPLCFRLFRVRDKVLRNKLHAYIVGDIRALNADGRNSRINRTLQNYMYGMLEVGEDGEGMGARKSLAVMIELYRRKIWNDEKTVNVMATACLSKDTRLAVMAVKFFLGVGDQDEGEDSGSEEEEDTVDYKALQEATLIGKGAKKTKKRARKVKMAKAAAKRALKHREGASSLNQANFSALELLSNPQRMAERLFARVKTTNERMATRVLFLSLCSRLIGTHELVLLSFYSYLQKYLVPHQPHVTTFMAILAQSCHPLVPGDVLSPVLKTIANNFIGDHSRPEVMAAGLNAIREVCLRAPLAMDETLLQDLVQYKSDRDKGVVLAARSLLQLFRSINPELLRRKDRVCFVKLVQTWTKTQGLLPDKVENLRPDAYGKVHVANGVEGIELLNQGEEQGVMEGFVALSGSDHESDDASEEEESEEEEKEELPMDQTRILSQEEHERLRVLKREQELNEFLGRHGKGSKLPARVVTGERVRVEAIEEYGGKKRRSKEERLAQRVWKYFVEDQKILIMQKKEIEKTWGHKDKRTGGTTNREKAHNTKVWQMQRQSRMFQLRRKRGRFDEAVASKKKRKNNQRGKKKK